MIAGGYRTNVIPSEGTGDDRYAPRARRGSGEVPRAGETGRQRSAGRSQLWRARYAAADADAKLDSDAFKALEANITKHYKAVTLPTMSTGATDMAFLRRKGMQCYGIGPRDRQRGRPKGFGAHSDQERILESELYRFVHFNWDAVVDLARAK
jgi:acetylornithine deacetylase/succinyl-diaminopimelate desuccinylase-like protein